MIENDLERRRSIVSKTRENVAERKILVDDGFDKFHPLDCVVKTTKGKVAYGYVTQNIAAIVDANAAPVIVTEELYDHLDIKGNRLKTLQDRGFEDVRDAVEFGLRNPLAISNGNGDGSFNVFFKKDEIEKGLMYVNLMYNKGDIPCFVVRSVSPSGKISGNVLFDRDNISSMELPGDFDGRAFETKIRETNGNRVSGKTWNKGNVMKGMRMHAQEGKYPNDSEIVEFKQLIAEGKLDFLTSGGIGMYINQALEQSNCAMFFDIAKKCGVWAKVAPDIDVVVNDEFLDMMKRAENTSSDTKAALLLVHLVADSEKKASDVKNFGMKYNIQGRDLAAVCASVYHNLINIAEADAATAYKTVD